MAVIREQLDRIDNLNFRERAIIMGGGLILIFIFWFNYFYEPLQKEKQALRSSIEQKRNESGTLALQLQVLSEKKQPDPNIEVRQRRDQLQADIQNSRNGIIEATSNLVAPERMPELLKAVLEDVAGLQLVRLGGVGKTPLIPVAEEETEEEGATAEEPDQDFEIPYKHGMKIVFEGDFLTTLAYIRKLESLDWRFFWDSIDLEVKEYPRAVSSVTLYTLSLDQDWIGI